MIDKSLPSELRSLAKRVQAHADAIGIGRKFDIYNDGADTDILKLRYVKQGSADTTRVLIRIVGPEFHIFIVASHLPTIRQRMGFNREWNEDRAALVAFLLLIEVIVYDNTRDSDHA